ncbi:MAG TPA: hypothetical protein VI386_05935 [Candidatus Sulfotelmatobacter sp.]
MARFADVVKEHWEKGAVVVALVFEAAVAFERRAAEVSLETRFIIAGIAGLVAALSVAEMLRFEPKRSSAGFRAEGEEQPNISIWSILARVIVISSMSALSVFLLNETAIFHNIRLLQKTDATNPFVGTIEIQPAHTPTNLAVSLSTSQTGHISILDKAPASWNNLDPVDWSMQNDSTYGVTFFLKDFKTPQVFGCWYRLSAGAEELGVDVRTDSPEVRVLRGQQLHKYRQNIWICGGLICAMALVSWSYRSFSFRLLT